MASMMSACTLSCITPFPSNVSRCSDKHHAAQVTFLGVSKDLDACAVMAAAQRAANPGAEYACLQDRHFLPFTVSTQPFEQLSYAVLEWLRERQQGCDIVQVGPRLLHARPKFCMSRLCLPAQQSACQAATCNDYSGGVQYCELTQARCRDLMHEAHAGLLQSLCGMHAGSRVERRVQEHHPARALPPLQARPARGRQPLWRPLLAHAGEHGAPCACRCPPSINAAGDCAGSA